MGRYLKKFDKELYKKITLSTFLILPCVFLVCVLFYAIFFRVHAQSTGGLLGEGTGTVVGKAVGSLEGLTKGQNAGYQAGKEEGLSAKDTEVELAGRIREVEKLQVLLASGNYSDICSIHDDYAALISMKYNAVFTVDLGTAEINLKDDGLHILLEQPIVELNQVGEIKIVNEYQKNKYTGRAEDGYNAFNNSAKQMNDKAGKKLQEDESLQKAAKISAETQLKQLVNAVSLSKPEVIVEFSQ